MVVHDLIHSPAGDGWAMRKRSYRKLRVSSDQVERQLRDLSFEIDVDRVAGRMWAISARKPD